MIQDMELRGLSKGTQDAYINAIRALAKHYNRPPDRITEEQVRQFLLYLTQTRQLAKSTVRVYLYAIKFLYRMTLKRPWQLLNLMRIRTARRKLPVVLSPNEVWSLLNRVRHPAARMSLTLMYACGLRASEATRLCLSDIDSRRMVIRIRNGKGLKERYVPLPAPILDTLRAYWREHRPQDWLFPSPRTAGPISRNTVLKCLKAALPETDIRKNVSCHTLRHSYATHLLERRVNLRIIQAFLGHRSLKTTMVYLHLTDSTLHAVRGVLDDLMSPD